MLGILFAIGLSIVAIIPSSLIAMLYLRRKGHQVAIWEAPTKFMEVGPPAGKAVLISFNFLNIGAIIWFLFFYLDL